jgi:hypothetical protein
MTRDPDRKVVLREARTGPDQRFLSAYVSTDGALHIEGQDLGPATAPPSHDGEYEWFETIRPEHLPRLVELLGGEPGTDLLDLLAERYTEPLRESCRLHALRGWSHVKHIEEVFAGGS